MAGRYDNPIPTRCLAPIDFLKIPALAGLFDSPIPTWFLAPIDCFKNPAQEFKFSLLSNSLNFNESIRTLLTEIVLSSEPPLTLSSELMCSFYHIELILPVRELVSSI